jgi:hypothetical protein
MESGIMKRLRWQLRTFMFIIAILALLLVVVTQQVLIGRQQAEIGRMRQTVDAAVKAQVNLTTIIREQRDMIERHR